jgi:hypothetical protein
VRRLLPLLLLLTACEVVELPVVTTRTATCDDDGWTLTATAEHPSGPDALAAMEVDVGLLFYDELTDETDLQFLQTLVLDEVGPGGWARTFAPAETALQCGFEGEYQLVFVVIAEDGAIANVGLRIDGRDARVDGSR